MNNETHIKFMILVQSLKMMVDVLGTNCDCENLLDVPLSKLDDDINAIQYVLNLIAKQKNVLAKEQSDVGDFEVIRQVHRDMAIIEDMHCEKVKE